MALDPTAREANVRDSLKKFFWDTLGKTYKLSFDRSLATPRIQGQPSEIDRWIGIDIGAVNLETLAEIWVRMFLCTRKDNEGFRLAQMRDNVVGELVDSSKTDGMRRITLYRSYENQDWTVIGGLVIQDFTEAGNFEAPDDTKYKIIDMRLRWGAKV